MSGNFQLIPCLNICRPLNVRRIFAESAIYGNGQDWNAQELKLLGAIGIAVEVDVYDDGRHHQPVPHAEPFAAQLLFTAGGIVAQWPAANAGRLGCSRRRRRDRL